jgi:hypothetical protein
MIPLLYPIVPDVLGNGFEETRSFRGKPILKDLENVSGGLLSEAVE